MSLAVATSVDNIAQMHAGMRAEASTTTVNRDEIGWSLTEYRHAALIVSSAMRPVLPARIQNCVLYPGDSIAQPAHPSLLRLVLILVPISM